MLLPLSVMAMTPISDNDMSKVTGQAGVSINADITLNLTFAEMGWGDSDGLMVGTYQAADGGWIGLDSLDINQLHIWPRTDMAMESDGSANGVDTQDWLDLQFLTIDVVTVPDTYAAAGLCIGPFFFNGQAGLVGNQVSAVRIGVPTFTITMAQMTGNVVLGPIGAVNSIGGMVDGAYYAAKAPNTPAFNQLMGQFDVSGLNLAFGSGGAVMIAAHGSGSTTGSISGSTLYGSGVTIEIDDFNIAYLLLDNASWGDIDGAEDICLATSTATSQAQAIDTEGLNGQGWVGVKDLAIEDLRVNGKIAIDVGTLLASDGTTLTPISAGGTNTPLMMAEVFEDAYNTVWQRDGFGANGRTFVAIAIVNGFEVTMGQMGAVVSLGPTAALGQDLGDIYVKDMTMTIYMDQLTKTQSFVQIFAH